jgi:hypothetical protein
MLFNCPCTNNTVDIPLPQAIYISDNEIDRICLYESCAPMNNPWEKSHLQTSGIVQDKKYKATSLDDIDYEEDDEEDETPDMDMSGIGGWEE